MSKVIGLTGPLNPHGHASGPNATYLNHLKAVGATPYLLSPELGLDHALGACDGFVITGGADIPPAYYHATDRGHPCRWLSPARATWEFSLLSALRTQQPHKKVLGVCLGMQWQNVVCGGTLYQHLPAEGPQTSHPVQHVGHRNHPPSTPPAGSHPASVDDAGAGIGWVDAYHPVQLVPGSVLAQLFGATTAPSHRLPQVASFHHQGVAKLGAGLVAQAHAPDGLIEALTHQTLPWLGVQWHPERDTTGPTLFRWVVS